MSSSTAPGESVAMARSYRRPGRPASARWLLLVRVGLVGGVEPVAHVGVPGEGVHALETELRGDGEEHLLPLGLERVPEGDVGGRERLLEPAGEPLGDLDGDR